MLQCKARAFIIIEHAFLLKQPRLIRESTYSDHPRRSFRSCLWNKWVVPAEQYEQFRFSKCFGNVLVRCGFGQGCVFPGSGNYPKLIGLEVLFLQSKLYTSPIPGKVTPPYRMEPPVYFFREIDKIGYTRVVSEQNRVVRGEHFLGAVIGAVLRIRTPKKRFGVLRAHKE